MSSLLQIDGSKPTLQIDVLGTLFGIPITNVAMMTWLITLVIIIALLSIRRLQTVPTSFQVLVEALVEGVHGMIKTVSGSEKRATQLLTVIGPLFLFILLSNTIGLFPFIGSFTYNGVSLFRTATSDYNMTLPLGLAVSLFVNGSIMAQIGVLPFIEKFIQIRSLLTGITKGPMGMLEGFIAFFLGLMDIIGEIAKILSMTLRLFGNIYAGEVMTVVFYSLFAVGLPSAWHVLSTFSGVIQALVFTFLTIVFYSISVTEE